ncbi:toxin glutamine deamidase domain-containing protein [Nocardia sp. Marseille-Q1738]
MGIEIPGWLQWAAKWLVGAGDWPEGDETAMRRVADAWSGMSAALNELDDDAAHTMQQALAAIDGQTHDAIAAHWDKLAGKEGAWQALVKYIDNLADQIGDGAADIEHTKLVIIGAMVIFAIEVAPLLATAWTGFSAGGAVVLRVATQVTIRMAIKQLIARMLTRAAAKAAARVALLAAINEALEEGGLEIGVKIFQLADGRRDEVTLRDWKDAGIAALAGAAGGAVGGGLGRSGLLSGVDDVATSRLGRAGIAATTETATGIAGETAAAATVAALTDQPFQLTLESITSSAAQGVPHGLHSAAGTRPTDTDPDTTPPDIDDPGPTSPAPSDSQPERTQPAQSDTGEQTQPSSTQPEPEATQPTSAHTNANGTDSDSPTSNPAENTAPAPASSTQAQNATVPTSEGGDENSSLTLPSPDSADPVSDNSQPQTRTATPVGAEATPAPSHASSPSDSTSSMANSDPGPPTLSSNQATSLNDTAHNVSPSPAPSSHIPSEIGGQPTAPSNPAPAAYDAVADQSGSQPGIHNQSSVDNPPPIVDQAAPAPSQRVEAATTPDTATPSTTSPLAAAPPSTHTPRPDAQANSPTDTVTSSAVTTASPAAVPPSTLAGTFAHTTEAGQRSSVPTPDPATSVGPSQSAPVATPRPDQTTRPAAPPQSASPVVSPPTATSGPGSTSVPPADLVHRANPPDRASSVGTAHPAPISDRATATGTPRRGDTSDAAQPSRPTDPSTRRQPDADDPGPVNPESMSHSGGAVRPRDDFAAFDWAEDAYDHFRRDDRDIDDIARTLDEHPRADGSHFTRDDVEQIKNHLFREEHPITDYDGNLIHRRFDADPDIAEAWIRLRAGHPLPADIVLLEHELAESTYLRAHPESTYQDAHAHANLDHHWSNDIPPRTGERYDTLWGRHDGTADLLQPDQEQPERSGVPVRGDEGQPRPHTDHRQDEQHRPHGPTGGRDLPSGRRTDHDPGQTREAVAPERRDRLVTDHSGPREAHTHPDTARPRESDRGPAPHSTRRTENPSTTTTPPRDPGSFFRRRPRSGHADTPRRGDSWDQAIRDYADSTAPQPESAARRGTLPVEDRPYYANPDFRDRDAADEYARNHPHYLHEVAGIRARAVHDHPEVARLTDAEIAAIRHNQFLSLNEHVNRATRDGDARALKEYDAAIRALVGAYNRLPDYHGVVHRSLYIADPVLLQRFLDEYQVENTPRDRGFASSDKESSMPGGNIELIIESRHGKDISWASGQQDEVVFPPGHRFRVDNRTFENGKHIIYLTDLGRNPDGHQSRGNGTDSTRGPRSYDETRELGSRDSGTGGTQHGRLAREGSEGPTPSHRGADQDLASLGRVGTEADRSGTRRDDRLDRESANPRPHIERERPSPQRPQNAYPATEHTHPDSPRQWEADRGRQESTYRPDTVPPQHAPTNRFADPGPRNTNPAPHETRQPAPHPRRQSDPITDNRESRQHPAPRIERNTSSEPQRLDPHNPVPPHDPRNSTRHSELLDHERRFIDEFAAERGMSYDDVVRGLQNGSLALTNYGVVKSHQQEPLRETPDQLDPEYLTEVVEHDLLNPHVRRRYASVEPDAFEPGCPDSRLPDHLTRTMPGEALDHAAAPIDPTRLVVSHHGDGLSPVWRDRSDGDAFLDARNALFRMDSRGPEIFGLGFAPRDPSNLNIGAHVGHTGPGQADGFVSLSRSPEHTIARETEIARDDLNRLADEGQLTRLPDGTFRQTMYMHELYHPHGIDVDATFHDATAHSRYQTGSHREAEILAPGGISSDTVYRVWPREIIVDASGNLVSVTVGDPIYNPRFAHLDNPRFADTHDLPTLDQQQQSSQQAQQQDAQSGLPATEHPPQHTRTALPAPPPHRSGFDPAVHRYVAHFNDGRVIPPDPFYYGEYNPHIGRYQPTPQEIEAAHAYPLGASPYDIQVRNWLDAQSQQHANHRAPESQPPPQQDTWRSTRAPESLPPTTPRSPSTPPHAESAPPMWAHQDPNYIANSHRRPDWWPRAEHSVPPHTPETRPTFADLPSTRAPESLPPPPTHTPSPPPRVAEPHPLASQPQPGPPHFNPAPHETRQPAPHPRRQSEHTNRDPRQHADPRIERNTGSEPRRQDPHNPVPPHDPRSSARHTELPDHRRPIDPEIQRALEARNARENYRRRAPEDGRVIGVRPNRATGVPAYEMRRYTEGPEHIAVLSVRIHLEAGAHISPQEMRSLIENAHLATDRAFNYGRRLLSGDWLMVDVVFTNDPSTAHLSVNVDHGTGDPRTWHPHDTPDVLANHLREHLGLPADSQNQPTVGTEDLRQISNDIAAANAPARFTGLPETRVIDHNRLDDLEDQAYQAMVEDSLRDGDRFTRGADPRTHPYGQLVNDGGPGFQGRRNNCLDCALAALASFFGSPQVSLPRWPDLLPDGTVDDGTGEQHGLERAARWLGSDLSSLVGHGLSLPDQFAAVHDLIAHLGPGSAALIVNEWHARDSDGNLRYDSNGDPITDGTHATVIVYPPGASGPVWWDPQSGETSDHPPTRMVNDSTQLWFTPIPPDQGVNNAGDSNRGPGGSVPGRDIQLRTGIPDSSVRERVGLRPDPDTGGDRRRTGTRLDEIGDRFRDRGRDRVPQLVGTDGDGRLHGGETDRAAADGRSGLPAAVDGEYPTDAGRPDRSGVLGTSVVDDVGAQHRTPSDHRQADPALPDEHFRDPSHLRTSESVGIRQQESGRDLAGTRDVRVLDDVHERSGTANPAPTSAQVTSPNPNRQVPPIPARGSAPADPGRSRDHSSEPDDRRNPPNPTPERSAENVPRYDHPAYLENLRFINPTPDYRPDIPHERSTDPNAAAIFAENMRLVHPTPDNRPPTHTRAKHRPQRRRHPRRKPTTHLPHPRQPTRPTARRERHPCADV